MTPTPPAELTVPPLFSGPPGSANGGYLAGVLAQHVTADAVVVTLRTPPPLAEPMQSRDVVLGWITARVEATPPVGEPCVVTSQPVAQQGHKYTTCSAVYGADGRLLGNAESIWIELRPQD